jgi:rubrerythrin
MADIAAEIEAKKAYSKALKQVRDMRKAGKSAREIFEWANAA